jgi:hypothetical protein
MTRSEIQSKCNESGMTYSDNQAMSGSLYIRINGDQYRVSDHYQPSHYQIRNYTDVSSIQQAYDMAMAKKSTPAVNFTYEIVNGVVWYDRYSNSDGFYKSTVPQEGVYYN